MKDLCLFLCGLLVAFCISQTSASSVVFETKDCGSKDAVVKEVTMFPAVAKRNAWIAFKSTLISAREIKGGKFKVRIIVPFLGIPITTFTDGDDLCNMIRNGTCPIKANEETVMTYKLHIGPLVRYGDFKCKITYTDEKGKQFVCFTLQFPFHPSSSETTPRVKSVV